MRIKKKSFQKQNRLFIYKKKTESGKRSRRKRAQICGKLKLFYHMKWKKLGTYKIPYFANILITSICLYQYITRYDGKFSLRTYEGALVSEGDKIRTPKNKISTLCDLNLEGHWPTFGWRRTEIFVSICHSGVFKVNSSRKCKR